MIIQRVLRASKRHLISRRRQISHEQIDVWNKTALCEGIVYLLCFHFQGLCRFLLGFETLHAATYQLGLQFIGIQSEKLNRLQLAFHYVLVRVCLLCRRAPAIREYPLGHVQRSIDPTVIVLISYRSQPFLQLLIIILQFLIFSTQVANAIHQCR